MQANIERTLLLKLGYTRNSVKRHNFSNCIDLRDWLAERRASLSFSARVKPDIPCCRFLSWIRSLTLMAKNTMPNAMATTKGTNPAMKIFSNMPRSAAQLTDCHGTKDRLTISNTLMKAWKPDGHGASIITTSVVTTCKKPTIILILKVMFGLARELRFI